MKEIFYNRENCKNYAIKYALTRNTKFYNFDKIGGNCTNFASQCLYAGLPVMNYSSNGWYYNSISNRSPAWSNVNYFYNFLTSNTSVGPYGKVCPLTLAEVGDFIQLKNSTKWYHTLVITSIEKEDILVCANTQDSLMRKLSSYNYNECRCIKILGGRSY